MASINLKHTSGNGTILNSPAANPSSDITLKLPSTTGSAGQVLSVASANHSSPNAELEFVAAGGGKVLQVVSTTKQDTASQASLGQGEYWNLTSILKVDITPASASNKILISGHVNFMHDGSEVFALALYRDNSIYTAANGTVEGNRRAAMSSGFSERAWDMQTCVINFLDTSLGNTNQKSYSVGLISSTGSDRTYYLNRPYSWTDNSQYFNWQSTITAMEIAA